MISQEKASSSATKELSRNRRDDAHSDGTIQMLAQIRQSRVKGWYRGEVVEVVYLVLKLEALFTASCGAINQESKMAQKVIIVVTYSPVVSTYNFFSIS